MLRLVLALLLMAGASGAQEVRVPVRVGDHPGLGRVVFDWPTAPAYTVEREGGRVRVRFPAANVAVDSVRRLPRNVLALRGVEGGVELTIAEGARLRHFRNGPKVAFDVMDAAETAPVRGRAGGAA